VLSGLDEILLIFREVCGSRVPGFQDGAYRQLLVPRGVSVRVIRPFDEMTASADSSVSMIKEDLLLG